MKHLQCASSMRQKSAYKLINLYFNINNVYVFAYDIRKTQVTTVRIIKQCLGECCVGMHYDHYPLILRKVATFLIDLSMPTMINS